MSYYHSVAFKLPVLKTAPLPVLEFFDKVFHAGDVGNAFKELLSNSNLTSYGTTNLVDSNNPVMSDMDYFSFMVRGHNAYFEAWYQNIKEETNTTILYETYHSCKSPCNEFALSLLNCLLPALDLKEGDIVYRTVGEEGYKETIIYLKGDALVLSDEDGWVYDGGYAGGNDDVDHPHNHSSSYKYEYDFKGDRHSREDISFDLPWNVFELKTQLESKSKKVNEYRGMGWW